MTGETVKGALTYYDPEGDIEIMMIRDKNGSVPPEIVPVVPPLTGEGEEEEENPQAGSFFFPGTTGTVEFQFEIDTNQSGPHTLVIWVEDSEASMSNKLEFTVNVSI
jgi:hypothetical protein